jgi:hypothetical protein
MRISKHLFFSLLLGQLISFCGNNQTIKSASPADTTKAAGTSAENSEDTSAYLHCNERFFSIASNLSDTTGLKLKLKNNHEVAWGQFVNDELMSSQVRWAIKNFDNDVADELVVSNFTGGAHCCDELYVFEKEGDHYRQRAKLFGGFICIDAASNIVTFSFTEALAYFFACYACGFADSSGQFKTIREIELKYDNGRFVVVPYHPDTEKQLMQNLALLSKHKYEDMEEGLMDSGWRKEFAMNLAVWHYNHNKNWTATKALFDRYYTFKDASRVWKEFRHTLQEFHKENDF